MRLLDLFAGSGSVGIEALSQGAAHCTFIDLGREAIATIKKNLESTGFAANAIVRQTNGLDFLKTATGPFDLIYIAPPQYKNLWVEAMRLLATRPELLRRPNRERRRRRIAGLAIVQIDPREYQPLDSRRPPRNPAKTLRQYPAGFLRARSPDRARITPPDDRKSSHTQPGVARRKLARTHLFICANTCV